MPEVGLQALKTQAQRAARVRSCHLAQEGFQGLPLQQLHKPLPLDMTLNLSALSVPEPDWQIHDSNHVTAEIASWQTCSS